MTYTALSKSAHPLGTCPNVDTPITPAIASPVISCVGDSNTLGDGNAFDSYRIHLHNMLVSCGLNPTWVGSQTSGTAPANKHHGIFGATAGPSTGSAFAHLDHYDNASTGFAPDGPHDPDLFIVMLGVNDVNLEVGTFIAGTRPNGEYYQQLLESLHDQKAGRRFVVAYMQEVGTPGGTRYTNILATNPSMPAVWDDLETYGLSLVRCDPRVTNKSVDFKRSEGNPSGLHLNDIGQIKTAAALLPAVLRALGYDAAWPGDTAVAA